MKKLWLIVTFGLMLGMALQWILILTVTLFAGGDFTVHFKDPILTLGIELGFAILAAGLAFVGIIRYGRLKKSRE